ncbi:MAG: hypothetical protein WBI82_10840 [Sphaerochaeta sp.]
MPPFPPQGAGYLTLHVFMEQKHLSVAVRFSTNTAVMEQIQSSLPQSDYTYTLAP